MKSFGTVVINDSASVSGKPSKNDTFVVNLTYRESKYYSDGTVNPVSFAEFKKSHTRISPEKGLISSVKSFVSQFSGCDEAYKLRKRMIAISRIHKTISGEEFRFPIGCE